MTTCHALPVEVLEASKPSPALNSQYPTCPESILVLSSFLNGEDTAAKGCPSEGVSLTKDFPLVTDMDSRD